MKGLQASQYVHGIVKSKSSHCCECVERELWQSTKCCTWTPFAWVCNNCNLRFVRLPWLSLSYCMMYIKVYVKYDGRKNVEAMPTRWKELLRLVQVTWINSHLVLSFDIFLTSFSWAESPPRDLQITAYNCFAANNVLLMRNWNHTLMWKWQIAFPTCQRVIRQL